MADSVARSALTTRWFSGRSSATASGYTTSSDSSRRAPRSTFRWAPTRTCTARGSSATWRSGMATSACSHGSTAARAASATSLRSSDDVFGRSLEEEWSRWIAWEREWQRENLAAIRRHPTTRGTAADGSSARLGFARMVRFGDGEHPRRGALPRPGSSHRIDRDRQRSLQPNPRHPGRFGTLGDIARLSILHRERCSSPPTTPTGDTCWRWIWQPAAPV